MPGATATRVATATRKKVREKVADKVREKVKVSNPVLQNYKAFKTASATIRNKIRGWRKGKDPRYASPKVAEILGDVVKALTAAEAQLK